MINYGIVYGLSDYGLADRLGIPREEAKAFIDAYLERFPRVAGVHGGDDREAREQGYVTTLFGRRRQIPELKAATGRSHARRAAGGQHRIQGTAADVMKLAMVASHARCASGPGRGRSSRSTTSCSSRARRTSRGGRASSSAAR